MHALVSGKVRMAARTLLARAGGVFMWPGIALTERRGAASVPIPADVARFWISRLHEPEANDWAVLRCLAIAAQKLSEGDEAGAQTALDLPWAKGPRLWRAQDIAAHLPLFKDYAPAAGLLAKAGAWDESKHPRVPAGSREGGQFQSGGSGAAGEGSPAAPGIGHNAGPPLESPPEIPEKDPPAENLRNAFAKLAARWLARALVAAAFGPEGEFVVALEAAAETALWLYDKYPLIKAYLDGPKSLEELQKNVGKPGKGYDVHHIVEKTPGRNHKIPDALIDGPDNLVRISRLKHWEITGWFMTPQAAFDDLSPREYLKGKVWEKRRKVGIDALIRFKVLKP